MAVPTLIVEIAFDHGPYVVSPTWTNISSDVTNVSIHRGRSDDFDKNFTATANLVLNNNDRKYDPFNSSGTYFGKLTPRRQIRIRGTANGTTYDMFRGFVNGFPVTWADAGKLSTVTIECFDAMSLLQSTIIKNDFADIYTRSLNPYHYYKCSDPAGNTVIKDFGSAAVDLNVNNGRANETLVSKFPLALALSGNSADLSNTDYNKNTPSNTPTTGNATIAFWASFPTSVTTEIFLSVSNPSGNGGLSLTANNPNIGNLQVELYNGVSSEYQTRCVDKVTTSVPAHYVITYTASSGAINIYVNGVNRTSTNPVDLAPLTGVALFPTKAVGISQAVFQEVAMFNYLLSGSQIVDLYRYGAGNKTESTSARTTNILALTEFPAGFYNVHSTSVGAISGSPEPNANIADALYEAMNTEGGYAFVSKSGVIKTVDRTYVSTNSTSVNPQIVVTDTGTDIGYFKDDISIFYDGDNMRNEIVVNYGSSVQETATDSASISAYGRHSESIDTQMSTSAGAATLASYWLQYYSQLIPTVSELEVGTSADTLAKWQQLLSLELLDRFTFKRTPTVGSQFTQDMLINSIDFDLTPKRWGMKLNGSGRFSPTPPTVSMSAATSITTTSAVLNGTVSANGLSTGVVFQYSQDGSFGSGVTQVVASPSTVTGQNVAVSATLTGVLDAGYTYYFRIVASNAFVSTTASPASFTTSNAAPSVVAQAASSISPSSAILNGTVDANGSSTTVYFDYQTGSGTFTSGYSTVTATQSPVTANTPTAVSATISGLNQLTTYYWRIRALNAVSQMTELGPSFATTGVLPSVTAVAPTVFNQDSATIPATISSNGTPTSVTIELSSNGGSTWGTPVSAGTNLTGTNLAVSANFTGLPNNTIYDVRIKATNSAGTTTVSANATSKFVTYGIRSVFFGASGSWTAPTWVGSASSTIYDVMIAGGGGGAGGVGYGSGGGGGAGVLQATMNLASSIVVTVGAGGASAATGGTTSITPSGYGTVSAAGGQGGLYSNTLYIGSPPNGGTSGNGNAGGLGYYQMFTGVEAGGGGGGAGGVGGDHIIVDGNPRGGNAGVATTLSGTYYVWSVGSGGRGSALAGNGTRFISDFGEGGRSNINGEAGFDGAAVFTYYGPIRNVNGSTIYRTGTGWNDDPIVI